MKIEEGKYYWNRKGEKRGPAPVDPDAGAALSAEDRIDDLTKALALTKAFRDRVIAELDAAKVERDALRRDLAAERAAHRDVVDKHSRMSEQWASMATERDALQAENERLRTLLEPFEDFADLCRRVRAALLAAYEAERDAPKATERDAIDADFDTGPDLPSEIATAVCNLPWARLGLTDEEDFSDRHGDVQDAVVAALAAYEADKGGADHA